MLVMFPFDYTTSCFSLFQLILSHRILFNHLKESKIYCSTYQPNEPKSLRAYALLLCTIRCALRCVHNKSRSLLLCTYLSAHPTMHRREHMPLIAKLTFSTCVTVAPTRSLARGNASCVGPCPCWCRNTEQNSGAPGQRI